MQFSLTAARSDTTDVAVLRAELATATDVLYVPTHGGQPLLGHQAHATMSMTRHRTVDQLRRHRPG
ncbi:MAG: hypothetical protein R2854_24780 [Caldilineaceae bacterium]